MNDMLKIARYELSDVIRSKWAIAYALFFFATSELLVRFGAGGPRAMLSLGNVVLLVVPLVGLLFATLHFYNSRRFVEMLLVQLIDKIQVPLLRFTFQRNRWIKIQNPRLFRPNHRALEKRW